MAYVIGQACIGTKDTACIDVCPTDSIHGYQESIQLFIDPATCIDCDACAQACPVSAIFPGDQVPADQEKFRPINVDFFKSWDRSKSIAELNKKTPTAAVKDGEAGSSESTVEDTNWTEVEGWQAQWDASRADAPEEDPIDKLKRYGRIRSIFETPEKYIVRFFLPEKTPQHPFVYRYNLAKEVSTYNVTATSENNILKVSAKMADQKLAKLSGLVNSFPDRFYVELPMEQNIENVMVENKTKHIVDVIIKKKAA